MLIVMGVLRLGFLANLLSHPVVSGFITASGIMIATSQLKSILGIKARGETMPELLGRLVANRWATQMSPRWRLACPRQRFCSGCARD